MNLSREVFTTIIKNTPLVSIDLIVSNERGEILVGKRVNRPAQFFWFVPGGRIFKDETQSQAFQRISKAELGRALQIEDSTLLSSYDHQYADNVFGEDFTTHYVALGRKLSVNQSSLNLPQDQHSEYRWLSIDDLLADADVHQHTKNYFL